MLSEKNFRDRRSSKKNQILLFFLLFETNIFFKCTGGKNAKKIWDPRH